MGNGFDLAHGLPTRYEDFRKYLLGIYPKSIDMEHAYEHVHEDDSVAFIIGLISSAEKEEQWRKYSEEGLGDLTYSEFLEFWERDSEVEWKYIEKSLGRLPFEEYLERWVFNYEGEENVDCDDVKYELEFSSDNYYLGMLELNRLFTGWVNSIDESDIVLKQEFKKLINEERDFFINFNYTCVLEDIYNARNVCHIHGKKHDSELLFGHGEGLRGGFETPQDAFEKNLVKINNLLRKDTNDAYEKNKDFFAKLTSVGEIYSIGFSFSEVDLIYIEQICKSCHTERCTWYLSDYDYDEKGEMYKRSIREAGFKGGFKVCSIAED